MIFDNMEIRIKNTFLSFTPIPSDVGMMKSSSCSNMDEIGALGMREQQKKQEHSSPIRECNRERTTETSDNGVTGDGRGAGERRRLRWSDDIDTLHQHLMMDGRDAFGQQMIKERELNKYDVMAPVLKVNDSRQEFLNDESNYMQPTRQNDALNIAGSIGNKFENGEKKTTAMYVLRSERHEFYLWDGKKEMPDARLL